MEDMLLGTKSELTPYHILLFVLLPRTVMRTVSQLEVARQVFCLVLTLNPFCLIFSYLPLRLAC